MTDQDTTAGKKDPYDRTSSKRAASHLERLAGAGGKRLPIDLGAEHLAKLEDLKTAGYGATAANVIRKAIEEAHARIPK